MLLLCGHLKGKRLLASSLICPVGESFPDIGPVSFHCHLSNVAKPGLSTLGAAWSSLVQDFRSPALACKEKLYGIWDYG